MLNDQFVASYLQHARDVVHVYERDCRYVREIDLPAIGSAGGFSGKRDHRETFYSFTSFLYPTTIYHYDFATGESTLFRDAGIDFDPSGYETKQVFYPSKDGTQIPMFLVHRKGLKLDGQNPTRSAMRNSIVRRFGVESVDKITPRDVSITAVDSGFEVRAEYDHVAPFIANISFAVHFDKMALVRR